MTVDEKLDLLIEEISGIKGDVSSLKGDVSSLKGDVSSLKEDMVEVKGSLSSLDNRVTSLENNFLNFRVYVENTLEKKLDIMVEAQQVYEDRLPPLERLRREVELLKIDNEAEKSAISDLYDKLKTA